MTHVDDAIRRALSPEDLRALDVLGREQPILIQAMRALENQQRWVGVVGWLGGFLLFGVRAYCVLRFVQAPDLRTMILWGAGGGLTAMGPAIIKLWFFMEMQKNSIIRERSKTRREKCLASGETRFGIH